MQEMLEVGLRRLPVKLSREQSGFTLIEVLIVALVIALLITIAAVNFYNARLRAELGAAEANIRNVSTALAGYSAHSEQYPAAAGGVWKTALSSGGFMENIPNDPAGDPFRYCSDTTGFHIESQNSFGPTPAQFIYVHHGTKVVRSGFDPPNVFADCDPL